VIIVKTKQSNSRNKYKEMCPEDRQAITLTTALKLQGNPNTKSIQTNTLLWKYGANVVN